jgi:pimeloyl-ACP methyl ester carboxylesterase
MLKLLARVPAALVLLFCLVAGLGGMRAIGAARPPLRGEMVDIGGRRLRVVCEGPRSERPLVVFESGIFGFAADWGEVQRRLTVQGWRSCAYDRAGLGFSDPGPQPRDGLAVVRDEEAWLAAKGETGPLILVGHSMAGLHTRLFALRHPDRVKGLVLVDAMAPELASNPQGRKFIASFKGFSGSALTLARFGVLKALPASMADKVGLDGAPHAEKLFFFGELAHNRWAAAEGAQALAAADQARAAGTLDPALPVAVVYQGPKPRGGGWGSGRLLPALRSRHGFVERVPDATHASLLGRDHADVIVRALLNVAGAAAEKS